MGYKTNKQRVKEHLNNAEQFDALDDLIKEVAFSRRMYTNAISFLWAKAWVLLVENDEDIEYVGRVIQAMKDG